MGATPSSIVPTSARTYPSEAAHIQAREPYLDSPVAKHQGRIMTAKYEVFLPREAKERRSEGIRARIEKTPSYFHALRRKYNTHGIYR